MKSPQYTREIPRRYRLEASKCRECGEILFPPRLVCYACGSQKFESCSLTNKGKILTFTVVHTPAAPFSLEAPFVMAIVETEDGARLTCQVVDCDREEVSIGSAVELVFRKIQEDSKAGILCYGYKAVLLR